MTTIERHVVDESLQARFVGIFDEKEADVKLEPQVLFSSTRDEIGEVQRIYHRIGKNGSGFGIEKAAFYRPDKNIPYQIIDVKGSKQYLSISFLRENNNSDMRVFGENGTGSFSAIYYPYVGNKLEHFKMLRVSEGGKESRRIYSPFISEAEERGITDEVFKNRGISYNRETGIIEARLEDMVLRIADQAPLEEVLERYFPKELREDKFAAGTEHDVWARSDWMSDFGITWNRVVEVPVFSANS